MRSVRVPGGFDEADKHIENSVAPGDLVITADIPLAAGVIAKGALALNPRGTLYSKENIGERLAVRDMLDELRSSRGWCAAVRHRSIRRTGRPSPTSSTACWRAPGSHDHEHRLV